MKSRYSIVLLVAFAVLMAGTLYNVLSLVRSQEHEVLASEMTRADSLLQKRRESAGVLEKQLAAADKRWAEQTGLPGKSSSATVLDAVLRLAEDSQVRVMTSSTLPATKGKTSASYQAMSFNFQVEGDMPRVLAFASRLEQDVYPTLILDSMSLTENKETKGIFRLNINFSVYVFLPVSRDKNAESSTQ